MTAVTDFAALAARLQAIISTPNPTEATALLDQLRGDSFNLMVGQIIALLVSQTTTKDAPKVAFYDAAGHGAALTLHSSMTVGRIKTMLAPFGEAKLLAERIVISLSSVELQDYDLFLPVWEAAGCPPEVDVHDQSILPLPKD